MQKKPETNNNHAGYKSDEDLSFFGQLAGVLLFVFAIFFLVWWLVPVWLLVLIGFGSTEVMNRFNLWPKD